MNFESMNSVRVVLALIFFGATIFGAMGAWKAWRKWARRTSGGMFFAMTLTGIAVANLFRLWASTYTIEQALPSEVAWRTLVANLAECVPTILSGLYAINWIEGRWFKGQNGGSIAADASQAVKIPLLPIPKGSLPDDSPRKPQDDFHLCECEMCDCQRQTAYIGPCLECQNGQHWQAR